MVESCWGGAPASTGFHAEALEPAAVLSPSTPTTNQRPTNIKRSFQNGRTSFPSDGGETVAIDA